MADGGARHPPSFISSKTTIVSAQVRVYVKVNRVSGHIGAKKCINFLEMSGYEACKGLLDGLSGRCRDDSTSAGGLQEQLQHNGRGASWTDCEDRG